MRASSITPGRRLSTLPWIATLARLPKVTWIAPDSIATELMYSLTILSATGRPAAALSTGQLARRRPRVGDLRLDDVGELDRFDDAIADQLVGNAGQRDQRQHDDDGDDDHQLDQREAARGRSTATIGAGEDGETVMSACGRRFGGDRAGADGDDSRRHCRGRSGRRGNRSSVPPGRGERRRSATGTWAAPLRGAVLRPGRGPAA